MSASRLVLSSPFDMPQRKKPPDKPVKVLTTYNGCKGHNIMVDNRVVRRSIFSTPKTPQNSSHIAGGWKQCNTTIQVDRRLTGGNSLFANPIVKVTVGEVVRERKKKVCTPSPVKGRKHVCIQTDRERIDECFVKIKSPSES